MSDYEYTDRDGDTIRIYPHLGAVYIQNHETGTGPASVAVAVDDAPAVALAILEAAGYDSPEHTGGAYAARDLLWAVTQTQKLKAEREAEDAKVRAFLDAMQAEHADPYEEITDGDRSYYRAARKFFEEQS